MMSLPLWYWCCYFRSNTKEFFFSTPQFFFSKPVFVISDPFLLFLRLTSFLANHNHFGFKFRINFPHILSSFLTATYLLWLDANTPLLWKKKNYSVLFFDRIYLVLEFLKVKYNIKRKKEIKINHSTDPHSK